MRLYFLRHGPAESRHEWEGPDAGRPLTERGITVTRRVAQHVARLELSERSPQLGSVEWIR